MKVELKLREMSDAFSLIEKNLRIVCENICYKMYSVLLLDDLFCSSVSIDYKNSCDSMSLTYYFTSHSCSVSCGFYDYYGDCTSKSIEIKNMEYEEFKTFVFEKKYLETVDFEKLGIGKNSVVKLNVTTIIAWHSKFLRMYRCSMVDGSIMPEECCKGVMNKIKDGAVL